MKIYKNELIKGDNRELLSAIARLPDDIDDAIEFDFNDQTCVYYTDDEFKCAYVDLVDENGDDVGGKFNLLRG